MKTIPEIRAYRKQLMARSIELGLSPVDTKEAQRITQLAWNLGGVEMIDWLLGESSWDVESPPD